MKPGKTTTYGKYKVTRISKNVYEACKGTKIKRFTDMPKKNSQLESFVVWIERQPCAECDFECCDAHHEPNIGMGGTGRKKDRPYFGLVVPLCKPHGEYIGCHKVRHNGDFDKQVLQELAYWAREDYPVKFLDFIFGG